MCKLSEKIHVEWMNKAEWKEKDEIEIECDKFEKYWVTNKI